MPAALDAVDLGHEALERRLVRLPRRSGQDQVVSLVTACGAERAVDALGVPVGGRDHRGGGELADRDVIRMTVTAERVERHHHVRPRARSSDAIRAITSPGLGLVELAVHVVEHAQCR